MGNSRRLATAIGLSCAVICLLPGSLKAQHASVLTPHDKSEVYIQHLVKIMKVDPSKYQAMVLEYELAAALVAGEVMDADLLAANFIENSLRELYPLYGRAVRYAEEKKDDEAARILRALLVHSDPYLLAHAELLKAELDFRAGKYDKVIERCERLALRSRMRLIADHRVCELIALSFEKLDKPLLAFAQYWILLVDYHDLPPRVESRVKTRVAALNSKVGRPMHKVAGWMNQVEKLLAEEQTAEDPTQKQEREIVTALDKLVELQEARERNTCSNCGSSDGSCRGGCKNGRPRGSRSNSPAQVSMIPDAGKGVTLLRGVSAADPSSRWGLLGEKNAARALQSFRGKLPARFERLLKEYYKALSREE